MPRLRPPLVALALLATLQSPLSAQQRARTAPHIRASAGNHQSGVAGTTLLAPIAAKVTDQRGRGVRGIEVTFVPYSDGDDGLVTQSTVRTNGAGVAMTFWRLPPNAGTARLHAFFVDSTTGTVVDTVTFVATVGGGEAASIIAGDSPREAVPGSRVPVSVRVRDRHGNPAPGAEVTWTVKTGDGTVAASTSVADSLGVAQVDFTIGETPGQNVLSATSGVAHGFVAVAGRRVEPVLARLDGSAFGIGRAVGGAFVVTEIGAGRIDLVDPTGQRTPRVIGVGGRPVVVAVDRAGQTAWVSNMGGWVDAIDVTSSTTSRVAVPNAHALALAPGGARLYVTSLRGVVYAVSTRSQTIVDSVAVPGGPWGIAFRVAGRDTLMYVTARDGGTITEVDTRTMRALRTMQVGSRPHGLAISRDQRTLYAAAEGGGVLVVDIASGMVTQSIAVPGAFGIAISPDGGTLYVTTNGRRAVVITTATGAIMKSYDLAGSGRQVITSLDGATAWTADEAGGIDVLRR